MYAYLLGNDEEKAKIKKTLDMDQHKKEDVLFVQDPKNAEKIYVLKRAANKYQREIEENLRLGKQVVYREYPPIGVAIRKERKREYGIWE